MTYKGAAEKTRAVDIKCRKNTIFLNREKAESCISDNAAHYRYVRDHNFLYTRLTR